MTGRVRRVAVIGAGLAGLACGLAAAARGLKVDIFDRAPAASLPSAHVNVVPNMLRDLVALGVGDECVRAGFPYRGVDVYDHRGKVQFTLPTPPLSGFRHPAALGIQYAELYRVLGTAAAAHGARLHWGHELANVRQVGQQAVLEFGSSEIPGFDLVVVAAGHASRLRGLFSTSAVVAGDVGQLWSYALVRRPTQLERPGFVVGTDARKLLLVPVKGDLAGVALIEPVRSREAGAFEAEHMKRALAQQPLWIGEIAAQLNESTPVVSRPVSSGLLPPPWHRGCVMAAGDFAHAIAPHFGQAAASAMEDASVLSELLGSELGGAELAESYAARRVERVKAIQEITHTAALWDLEPDSSTDFRQLMTTLSQTVWSPA